MNKIKVSILVPTFNVESYLDECIQSLISQTLKEIEIVIVDDGSADKTTIIAQEYASSDSRIRVIQLPEHQGVSFARNICLTHAKGKYLTFVDSDDYISTDAIENLYKIAESTHTDIVLGNMLYLYPDGRKIIVGDKSSIFCSENKVISGQECLKDMLKSGLYVPMVCGNLYQTKFIIDKGLKFKGNFHEDEYFTPYALYYARLVSYYHQQFYFYRQRCGSIMHNTSIIQQRAEALSYISTLLTQFANSQICGIDAEIRILLRNQGRSLRQRSQNLYEETLVTSTRKTLLIFSEKSIASQYGVGTYIRQLVQCFNVNEWDIHVVTLHSSPDSDISFYLENMIAWYDFPIPTEQLSSNAPIHEERYFKGIFYYWASRIGDGRSVYCHFNFYSHHQLASMFKIRLGTHIIFTLHYTSWSFDLLGNRELLEHYLQQPENSVKDTFEKEKAFMEECCDCVIAIANHSYNMLHEIYGLPLDKLAYIPNGLKDDYVERTEAEIKKLRKKYHYTDNERIILFAGRLDRVKGIIELIESFKSIQEIIPETRLIIAGNGNFNKCMEVASPCWKYISFTGFISKEQLYELYAIADVGVVPSIHEEFGYVACEMMLNKLPIVVHDTTGLKEITDNGKYATTFYFDKTHKHTKLKDAILNALNNRNMSIELGREYVLNHYTIPLFHERITNIYRCMRKSCNIINN